MAKFVEIKNDELTAKISLTGAELMSVKNSDGKEFMWEADKNVWANCSPILFPICGGLKEDRYELFGKEYHMNKHGFIKYAEFFVEDIAESSVTLKTCQTEETLRQYPFDFEFRVIFELEGKMLKTTYSVDNKTDKTMYFSVGSHEAYACSGGIENYTIEFEKPETLKAYILDGNLLENNFITITKDSDKLDLLYEYFAVDALVFKTFNSKKVSLVRRDGSTKINVEFPEADYLLFWTKPNGNYICIEPWSGIQDIVDSSFDFTEKEGILTLEPNKNFKTSHNIIFEK